VPIPPSTYAALAGATVLANLSASNITIGKADYRRELAASQSGRCIAAYLYSAAGAGESSTDLAWDGDALICENGRLLAEAQRFSAEDRLITADIDLDALAQDRMRMTSFADSAVAHAERVREVRSVAFAFEPPKTAVALRRVIPRFPYVPSDPKRRDERCYEAYKHPGKRPHQAPARNRLQGDRHRRVRWARFDACADRSGQNDGPSRQAALADQGLHHAWVRDQRSHAQERARADETLGVTAEQIDIKPSCLQMFRDIGHPFARASSSTTSPRECAGR